MTSYEIFDDFDEVKARIEKTANDLELIKLKNRERLTSVALSYFIEPYLKQLDEIALELLSYEGDFEDDLIDETTFNNFFDSIKPKREFGYCLNEWGGFELMQFGHTLIDVKLQRLTENYWHDIGDWLS